MSKKVYRSAQGKTVDLGALQLQNETVRAVGNMGVNARGDVINNQNTSIKGRTNRIGSHYKKQITNVADDVVPTTKHDQPKSLSKEAKRKIKEETPTVEVQQPVMNSVAEPVVEDPVAEPEAKLPQGGLAAAIAKARTVKQEAMKTPRQIAQEQSGVKKI